MSVNKIASYAFHCGASFFGGKPFNSVIYGYRGQLVFFFKENQQPQFYLFLIKNHLTNKIRFKEVHYKGKQYTVYYITVSYKVNKKFLYNFRRFSKVHHHLINVFA